MKSAITKYLGLIILAVCMLIVWTPLLSAQDNQVKKMLVLHSYHRGLSWDDAIDRGIESVFKNENLEIGIQTEYMDTKRINDSTYIKKLHDIYKYKFRNRRFDVIISSDNNALNFLLKNRDEIFPETTVVFCGVNNFQDSMLEGHSLYTGTAEAVDIRETLDIALKLHPETKHIFAYGSNTTTYLANKESLIKIIPDYQNSVDFTFIENLNIRQIQNNIREIQNNSLILQISTIRDEHGELIPFERSAEMMASVSNVPIYGCWDFFLGHGIVGGKLISGFAQGETAAHMALRILKGEKLENIPVVKESPNRYMFDYKQMQRFAIKFSELPENSIIINRPSSFYSEHRGLIWSFAASIASLSLIILFLTTNIIIRKRAEKALKESENKYRSLVNNVKVGIFRTTPGPTGRFLEVNPAMGEITGYSRKELLQMEVSDLYVHPEERGAVLEEMTAAPGKATRELNLRKKAGAEMVVSDTKFAVRDNTGEILYFDGILEDITEKKKLEAQLQQAKKIEAIGTLAGGIAHNFNNLLMGIQGNASLMLLDTDPSNPIYERLNNIEKLVQSGSKLASQLLGYARGGRYEVRPISLNQSVKETSDTFGITRKEISVHQELDKDLAGIRADQGQIEQVLLNLYVNAADAMPGGGDLFLNTINVTHKDITGKPYKVKPGSYVSLTVRDTGIGMDKETMERIFEPFFTTKGLAKGTGLGLASVYGIVKAHAGYIDVYSDKGHGTTFKIYLPATEKKVIEEKEKPVEVLGGTGTVLLVDDEDMVIDVGEEMLKKIGYNVLLARSGKEAIDVYNTNKDKIDIVILDMIMPYMDGGESYDRLKEINPDIKVLLSSGYSINGQATEILERGCNGFIQKPFSMKDLSVRIREILDKK